MAAYTNAALQAFQVQEVIAMRAINALSRCCDIGSRLLLLVAVTGLGAAAAMSADEPGAWQSHQLRFNYLGPEPLYSCQGLKDTLTGLLRQSGAGQQISVVPGPCIGGYSTPQRIIYAELKFSSLMPPAQGGTASEGETVSGSWHKVMIAPRGTTLGGGACELVQQFRDKVLPMFATRDMKSNLNCVPFQTTGYLFALSFETFAPANAKLPTSWNAP